MAIMSGLVERNAERQILRRPSHVAEWMVRNAWTVVIGSSLAFWLILATILVVR